MRLSIVLNLLCTVAFSANSFSQSQSFSVNLENAKVRDVFRSIEGQSTYRFFYNDELTDINRVVSLNIKDKNIEEVLSQLFTNTDISYTILENNLVVIAPKRAIQQQKITGIVVDANNGQPVPGVSVQIEGTTTGAITDLDGKFSLEAPQNGVLLFSFMGYLTEKVTLSGQSTVDVKLVADIKTLDEIVVVGYGTQKKSDITGSITSVDVKKLRDVPASSISKALQGKVAGVEIQNIGSRPGGNTQIRIRGNRSLSASNDPLYIVDGIPFGGSLNDLATDNIASIEVLKDASATVIYGSRGSNGVVIITTKRGEAGKLNVSYNGYTGITNVARKYDVFNAEEYVKLRTAAGYTNYLPFEKQSMLLGRETNWQDLVYQNGVTANHELNVTGGTEKAQYAFSGGYYNETGILPQMGFKRYSMSLAVDQKLGKRVTIGLSTMNSYSITDGQSASMMWPLVSLSPLSTPYTDDGTVREQPNYDTENTYSPLTLADHSRWKEQNLRKASFSTLYAEVKLFDGLKYRLNTGLNYYQNKYNNFYGSNTPMKNDALNSAQVQNRDYLDYTIENLLTYDKIIAENHRISITGLYSAEEATTTQSQFDATNVPANYLQYNNLSLAETTVATTTPGANYYNDWTILSFMGRINYAFKDKYLVTITGRSDGSSRLSPGRKWHSYPAVALGWNISKESFLVNSKIVSNLKLRLGYGQTSNTSINPYATLGGLSSDKYSFGATGVDGYYVSTLPNTELTWEYTKQTNIGLDFGFLNNRITGSVDVYKQTTNGVLLGKQLPPSIGVPGSFLQNIGSTQNMGLEVVLTGDIISRNRQDGFNWEISTNLFLNREKITALQDPSITKDVGNGWFVGYPSSEIYDYIKLGIWQLGEEDQAAVYGKKPGDIKLKDTNKDGKITADDRAFLGSSQPDFQGGFTSTWEFKGFDLSVVGYYKVKGKIVSTLHMPNSYVNRLDGRRNGIKVDYWTPTNPTNDMPAPNVAIDATYTNVLGYFDGSFLKIRSINLGYNVNRNFIKFLGAGSSVRVYASVTDPFILFSPYIKKGGVDPEPTGTAQYETGASTLAVPSRALIVGLNIPPTTKFIFGINVKF